MDGFLKTLVLLALFVIGYLFGSIPNGVIISKVFYGIDPRSGGSKNTGGTNVGRVVSKKAGIITIALDVLKILVPFIVTFAIFTYREQAKNFMTDGNNELNSFGEGNTLSQLTYYLIALAGMIGHSYSCFLNFKGGKIVASFSGYALCLTWSSVPIFLPIFFIVLKLKKYVSLSSLSMCGAFTLFTWIIYIVYIFAGKDIASYLMFGPGGPAACIYLPIITTLAYALMVYRHKSNIINLINHTEKTAGWSKKNN